jgi:hypothetical protein
MIIFSDATLKRKLRLDEILQCLGDYRAPGWTPTPAERSACAAMIDADMTPADAAEIVQATGAWE